MSDRYNSWVARLFRRFNGSKAPCFAVTLASETTFYDCPKEQVSEDHRQHEDAHKAQIKKLGWLRFMSEYIWQMNTKGYQHNKFEVQAEEAEKK